MTAYPVVFVDNELFGVTIPKEFIEFAYACKEYYPRSENRLPITSKMIENAIHNVHFMDSDKKKLSIIKLFLNELLTGYYSNDELTRFWRKSCYSATFYLGDLQREFVQEMYDAVDLAIKSE